MVEKLGSDQSQLATLGGGVISENGAPLLSGESTGESSLLFGPAALREIQAGVANGDFAITPVDANATITVDNGLPYWTFTDVNSAGSITAAIVDDATAASGNVLRFTIATATTAGKYVTLSRFIPVASSASQSFSFYAEATFDNATSTNQATAQMYCTFYKSDRLTTTGTTWSSKLYPLSSFATPVGITAPDLFGSVPDLSNTTAPSDAAFLKVTIYVSAVSLAVATVARTLTTATVTTSAVHGFAIGQSVTVALTSGPTGYSALNGTWTITGTPTTTSFTLTTVTSGTITSGAAVGTAAVPAASARTIDLTEVRVGHGLPELILSDKSVPTNWPAYIINDNDTLSLYSGSGFGNLDLGDATSLSGLTSLDLVSGDGMTITSGATGLTIDSPTVDVLGDLSGNGVTTDLTHGVTLQRTANLTLNTSIDASATAIVWSSAVKNTTLYAYWSSGATIAIPLTGWYSITCHCISGTGLGTGYAWRLYALVNGTVIAETEVQSGANTTSDTFSIATIAYMSAGDGLVFRASASAASKTIGGSRRSACSIVYLGNTSA